MEIEVPDYEVADQIEVDPDSSVLLIVDMQNDFVHPDGSLYNPDAEETVPLISRLSDQARASNVPVWYTQDTHRDGDPEWDIWGRHCERGKWGWEFVEELKPAEGDLVLQKSRYDGFYGTQLEHQLQLNDRDHLIICGTVANICVHYTAASAGLRYMDVTHPVDAISALSEFDYHASLHQASWLFQAQLVRAEGLRFTS